MNTLPFHDTHNSLEILLGLRAVWVVREQGAAFSSPPCRLEVQPGSPGVPSDLLAQRRGRTVLDQDAMSVLMVDAVQGMHAEHARTVRGLERQIMRLNDHVQSLARRVGTLQETVLASLPPLPSPGDDFSDSSDGEPETEPDGRPPALRPLTQEGACVPAHVFQPLGELVPLPLDTDGGLSEGGHGPKASPLGSESSISTPNQSGETDHNDPMSE